MILQSGRGVWALGQPARVPVCELACWKRAMFSQFWGFGVEKENAECYGIFFFSAWLLRLWSEA